MVPNLPSSIQPDSCPPFTDMKKKKKEKKNKKTLVCCSSHVQDLS